MSSEQLGPIIPKTKYLYLIPKFPFLLKPACVWFLSPETKRELMNTGGGFLHCVVPTDSLRGCQTPPLPI